jgi:hypothetical protein
MDDAVQALFKRHAQMFNDGLAGTFDPATAGQNFAQEFIASSPQGVMAGKNDASLGKGMESGYARYRKSGAKGMCLKHIAITPIDALHCLARVSWISWYQRKDGTDAKIDFDVHYFVRIEDGAAKIFGWVSGDEDALLKQHGIG